MPLPPPDPLPRWDVYAELVAKFWSSMPTFFVGSAAIDQLIALKLAASRHHANSLCAAMLQDGVFLRVGSPPSAFRDDHARYRLTWSSAEETRSNVMLQRAPAMPAPAISLPRQRGMPPTQFDDHISEDSALQEAVELPKPKKSRNFPFSVNRVRDLDRLGTGNIDANATGARVGASSPQRQPERLHLRAQLELLKSGNTPSFNNMQRSQHSSRIRPPPQPQRSHLTFSRRRDHHTPQPVEYVYHQRSASIDMPPGTTSTRVSLERPINHNEHPLKRLARSCSVDGADRRRRTAFSRSTSVDTRGGVRRGNIELCRNSIPSRDPEISPPVVAHSGAVVTDGQTSIRTPFRNEPVGGYESDFDAADDDSAVYGQPAAHAFASTVTEAGSNEGESFELPNMSTIREKLKRAFQDDKNNMKNTKIPNENDNEPRRLEPELMASVGNEGSPITTPRKPWRILRVLSSKTDPVSSTLSDDDNYTDKQSSTISTSLKEKFVRSLRRGRGWSGRDAFEDRRDPLDHQSNQLRRWRS